MSAVASKSAEDFLDLDSRLDADERAVRDTVRRFVEQEVMPTIGDHFEQGTFPAGLVPGLGELGLFGMHLTGYGCAGLSPLAYGLACRELERADSGLRSFVSVQGSLAMYSIWRYGSEEQKQRWLPVMATGEVIGCFGLTEPDHGSDPGGMATKAIRDGDSWVLTGTKMWITNAPIARVAVVWARTEDGVAGFLVELDRVGVRTRAIEHKLSLRASVTGEVVLDECRIPVENRLPLAKGITAPLSALSEARYGIAWGVVGAAQACVGSAVAYAGSREQFGRPIAAFQLIQAQLADMATGVTNAHLMAYRLAELKQADRLRPEHVSMAKRHNVRAALEIARQARAIHGANGISGEYPVFRHMANLETVLTYEGTEEIHTLVLGHAITGHQAYR